MHINYNLYAWFQFLNWVRENHVNENKKLIAIYFAAMACQIAQLYSSVAQAMCEK